MGVRTHQVLDSLLGEVRDNQTSQLYEDDWSAVHTPETTPRPSTAEQNWAKARTGIQVSRALDGVLETVRSRETERLYDQDWTPRQSAEASPSPSPSAAERNDQDRMPRQSAAANPSPSPSAAERNDQDRTPRQSAAANPSPSPSAAERNDQDRTPRQSAEANPSPSPSGAERNWAKLRLGVQVSRAMDDVLETVRSQETERLYDRDWTSQRAEVDSAQPQDEASEGCDDVAPGDTPSQASPSRAVANWHKAQRLVDAKIAMDSVLSSVRGKQTEDLYDKEWTASVVLRAARGGPWAEVDEVDDAAASTQEDNPEGEASPGGCGRNGS